MYEHKFSGTILNARVVISGTPSFLEYDGPLNVSQYKVKVGKTYIEYDDSREATKVQSFSVRKITVSIDIAILLLDDYIEFNTHISPVCIDYSKQNIDFFLNKNNDLLQGRFGLTSGWCEQKSDSSPSPFTRAIELKVAAPLECNKKATRSRFLTAFLHLDDDVCFASYGGALAFPEVINGTTKYFIRGIASLISHTDGSCTEFLNTADYLNVIERQEVEYRPTGSANGKIYKSDLADRGFYV